MTPTGLAFFKGSLDVSPLMAVNNVLTFIFIPAAIDQLGMLNVGFSPAISNPSAAVQMVAVPGPFQAINPSVASRVVSASLEIIPSSVFMNQGGSGFLAYLPTYNGFTWNRISIDNLEIGDTFSGVEAMTMHWTPNESETDYNASFANVANPSALTGYLTIPSGVATATTFRLEYMVGIEYIPTPAQRGLTVREPAMTHPDAQYWVNVVLNKKWLPLMICDRSVYLAEIAMLESLGGHSNIHLNYAGSSGVGLGTDNANIAEEDPDEELEAEPARNYVRTKFDLGNVARRMNMHKDLDRREILKRIDNAMPISDGRGSLREKPSIEDLIVRDSQADATRITNKVLGLNTVVEESKEQSFAQPAGFDDGFERIIIPGTLGLGQYSGDDSEPYAPPMRIQGSQVRQAMNSISHPGPANVGQQNFVLHAMNPDI
jgi:hypothetical protein